MQIQSQKFRFGLFVIIASLAVLAIVAVLVSQQFLEEKDAYYISYENISVSGLEVGSPVKYLGVNVGTVQDIYIDPDNVNRIIVKVKLQQGTPIKEDARADISTIGITGMKMIEIRGGSNEAPLLKPGEYIPAGTSMTEEITGKAEIIAEKFERLLNNLNDFTQKGNLNKIFTMVENTAGAFQNVNEILMENRRNLSTTLELSSKVTAKLDSMASTLNQSAQDLNEMVASDTVKQILSNTRAISLQLKRANLVQLIKELGEVVNRTNKILVDVDQDLSQGSEAFHQSMRKLQISLDNLNEASRLISEDPSVLLRGANPENVPDKLLE